MEITTVISSRLPKTLIPNVRKTFRSGIIKSKLIVNASENGDVQVQTGYKLGPLELSSPLGVGCWSWGNTSFWSDSWTSSDEAQARGAFRAALENNICFFDTAEAYNGPENAKSMAGIAQGAKSSEVLLGDMLRTEITSGSRPLVCTKFSALPWRVGRAAVVEALKASLARLQVESVDAYMVHWPGVWQNEEYALGLGDCVEMGLAKCVGVSNHNVGQMRTAHSILAQRGIPLSFNQLQYSLFYNNAETNGMLAAIKELDMTLMAYSPLQSGILTGKYSSTNLPGGPRGDLYRPVLAKADPFLNCMREIGASHNGKTPTQVALNYLICQGNVLPIPGAKSAEQAEEFAGALNWSLTPEEVETLRKESAKLRQSVVDASLSAKMVNEVMFKLGV
mmetsp:Transcript_39807/g.55280  ORF Transcript_39807/g.55280 Transcript_39807/m.55280 type:complete len:393 (+) Transcript_39807:74-1252(+)|eukprot:CAMPEP_0196586608 /NCGR_PEP_ID=MMETSP1081-20130531/54952_1 /TAXON_ID=36882 /ORGANISM="Pyramimonas amylifera, Strain CCMP720" /LENGTH=392 /DNA_ID=CAMNT_0041908547 /DNA_START=70 /DNA_END=1248 /DNA_ORIENTATION=+